jgi:hypothetical protein
MAGTSDNDQGSPSQTLTASEELRASSPGNPARGALPPGLLTAVPDTNYDLGKEHARGGLGRILVAKDRRLGRIVVPGHKSPARYRIPRRP